MAKTFDITSQEWTKLAPATGEDADLVLSTSASRLACHTEGAYGYPIVLKQLGADPTHPFTAGQMIVTLQFASTLSGERDVAHSAAFDHGLFSDEHQNAPGTLDQGGFYLADYRVPLEWLIQLYSHTTGGTTKYYLQINVARPDGEAIDEDDRTAALLTIDPNTAETVTDIVLANGTSTPAGEGGGVEMRWELTETQYDTLKPDNGATPPVRVYNKIGLTLAAASSVAPITYSAYEELHPDPNTAEVILQYEQRVGLTQPASPNNWYARMRWPSATGGVGRAKLQIGE